MSELLDTAIEFDNDLDIQEILTEGLQKNPGLVPYVMELYAYQSGRLKDKVDDLAAEISQKQERIKLLHEIIQHFNAMSKEQEGLDITDHAELQKKIELARQIGVEIPEGQLVFSGRETGYLIENLHLVADDFDKENRMSTQRMQILIQESDRFLMIANLFVKTDDRTKSNILRNMKS